ncbi:MAG: hypothetical protein AAF125_20750, partial [Chloroflexota bacterium]
SSSRTFPGTPYYNPLSQSELTLDQVAIINRVAEIELRGTLVIGDDCDVPRVQAMFDQIAVQYATVDEVEVTVNGESLEALLGVELPEDVETSE